MFWGLPLDQALMELETAPDIALKDHPEILWIHRATEAENIYFLGFGYHQSNLDKLNLSRIKKCNNIEGTCFKENIHNQRTIKEDFDNKIKLTDIECKVYQFMLKDFNPDKNYGVEAEPHKYR